MASMIDMKYKPIDYLNNFLSIDENSTIAKLHCDSDGNITAKISWDDDGHIGKGNYFEVTNLGNYDLGPRSSLSYEDMKDIVSKLNNEIENLSIVYDLNIDQKIDDVISHTIDKIDNEIILREPLVLQSTDNQDKFSHRDTRLIMNRVLPENFYIRTEDVYRKPEDKIYSINYNDSNDKSHIIGDVRITAEGGITKDNIKTIIQEIGEQIPDRLEYILKGEEKEGRIFSEHDKFDIEKLHSSIDNLSINSQIDSQVERKTIDNLTRQITLSPNNGLENLNGERLYNIFRNILPENTNMKLFNVKGSSNKIIEVSYENRDKNDHVVSRIEIPISGNLSRENIFEIVGEISKDIEDKISAFEKDSSLSSDDIDRIKDICNELQSDSLHKDINSEVDKNVDEVSENVVRGSAGRIFEPDTSIDEKGKIELKDSLKNKLDEQGMEKRISMLENKANQMLQVEKTLQRYEKMPVSVLRHNTHYFNTMRTYQKLAVEYDKLGGKTGKGFAITGVPTSANQRSTLFRSMESNIFTSVKLPIETLGKNEGFSSKNDLLNDRNYSVKDLLNDSREDLRDQNKLLEESNLSQEEKNSLDEKNKELEEKINEIEEKYDQLSENKKEELNDKIEEFKDNVDRLESDLSKGEIDHNSYLDEITSSYEKLNELMDDFTTSEKDIESKGSSLKVDNSHRIFDPCTSVNPKGKIELNDSIKNRLSEKEQVVRMEKLKDCTNTMAGIEKTLQRYEKMPVSVLRHNTHYFFLESRYQKVAVEYKKLGGKVGKDFAVTAVPSFGNRMAVLFRSTESNIFTSVKLKFEQLEDSEKFTLNIDNEKKEEKTEITQKDASEYVTNDEGEEKDTSEYVTNDEGEEKDILNSYIVDIKETLDYLKDTLTEIKEEISKDDFISNDEKESYYEKLDEIEKNLNDKENIYDKLTKEEKEELSEKVESWKEYVEEYKDKIQDIEKEYLKLEKDVDGVIEDNINSKEEDSDNVGFSEAEGEDFDDTDLEGTEEEESDNIDLDETEEDSDDTDFDETKEDSADTGLEETEEDFNDIDLDEAEADSDDAAFDESEEEFDDTALDEADSDVISLEEANKEEFGNSDLDKNPEEDNLDKQEEQQKDFENTLVSSETDGKSNLEEDKALVESAEQKEEEKITEGVISDENRPEANSEGKVVTEEQENNKEIEKDKDDSKEDAMVSEIKRPENVESADEKITQEDISSLLVTREKIIQDLAKYFDGNMDGNVDLDKLVSDFSSYTDGNIDNDIIIDAVKETIQNSSDQSPDYASELVESINEFTNAAGLDTIGVACDVLDELIDSGDASKGFVQWIDNAIMESMSVDLESFYQIDGQNVDMTGDSKPADPISGNSLSDVSSQIEQDSDITHDETIIQEIEQISNAIDQPFKDAQDVLKTRGVDVDSEAAREGFTEKAPELMEYADSSNLQGDDVSMGDIGNNLETQVDIPEDSSQPLDAPVYDDSYMESNKEIETDPSIENNPYADLLNNLYDLIVNDQEIPKNDLVDNSQDNIEEKEPSDIDYSQDNIERYQRNREE